MVGDKCWQSGKLAPEEAPSIPSRCCCCCIEQDELSYDVNSPPLPLLFVVFVDYLFVDTIDDCAGLDVPRRRFRS